MVWNALAGAADVGRLQELVVVPMSIAPLALPIGTL